MSEYSYYTSSSDEAELVVGEKLRYTPKLNSVGRYEYDSQPTQRNIFSSSDVSNSDIEHISDTEPERESVEPVDKSNDHEEDVEEEYEVEAVLAQRVRGRRIQYLVKWKGYPESESTWEDAENCSCEELIQEFHAREKRKQEEEAQQRRRLAAETERKARMKRDLRPEDIKVVSAKCENGKIIYTVRRGEEVSTFSSHEMRLEWTDSIIGFWENMAVPL